MVSTYSAPIAIVLLLLSGTAVADRSLSLKLTSSSKSSSTIRATLTNTGSEQLKLLNDPRSLLSLAPTDSFIFTSDDEFYPSFTGMKLKYSLKYTAKNGDGSSYTILNPKEAIEIDHDLSDAYTFGSREYLYGVAAQNKFYHWDDSTGQFEAVDAKVLSTTAKIVAPSSRKARTAVEKRAQFTQCTTAQQATLAKATTTADIFAKVAAGSLANFTTNGGPLYQPWFGAFSADRYKNATTHFNNVAKNSFNTYTYDCKPADCPDENTYAYVYPDIFGTIHLCNAFWKSALVGEDSQAGTLVHESTHFTVIAGTKDFAYGRTSAEKLAATNPVQALGNADNHEYFAETSFDMFGKK
ncbi:hypothetical protein VNI00_009722 [Paramarasmius palmivorus]|uniref:Lysine-specific metallo-endopeptidase domain-containing protein n=1 Tax=Paramarasmius palmivorus TaxID=297713 RepID=A0AAW0CNR1_9AGAR